MLAGTHREDSGKQGCCQEGRRRAGTPQKRWLDDLEVKEWTDRNGRALLWRPRPCKGCNTERERERDSQITRIAASSARSQLLNHLSIKVAWTKWNHIINNPHEFHFILNFFDLLHLPYYMIHVIGEEMLIAEVEKCDSVGLSSFAAAQFLSFFLPGKEYIKH